MIRRDEGHPVGAMLLLCSMFAFALVFHAVTQPDTPVRARFDVQLTALAMPASSEAPSFALPFTTPPAPSPTPIVAAPVEDSTVAHAAPPLLDAFTPPAPTLFRSAVSPVAPGEPAGETGAVTRALAGTSSALRNAFRKAF